MIVVEGLLDTVSIWQALQREKTLGEFSVVGLLGSDVSKAQVAKLKQVSDEVILFLDNDEAGNAGSEKLKKYLSKSKMLSKVVYPSSDVKDPDDAARLGYCISQLAREAELFTA